jgi:hypothetical protein
MSLHVDFMIDSTSTAVSDGFADIINAATPAAYGDEKDVPSIAV